MRQRQRDVASRSGVWIPRASSLTRSEFRGRVALDFSLLLPQSLYAVRKNGEIGKRRERCDKPRDPLHPKQGNPSIFFSGRDHLFLYFRCFILDGSILKIEGSEDYFRSRFYFHENFIPQRGACTPARKSRERFATVPSARSIEGLNASVRLDRVRSSFEGHFSMPLD